MNVADVEPHPAVFATAAAVIGVTVVAATPADPAGTLIGGWSLGVATVLFALAFLDPAVQ